MPPPSVAPASHWPGKRTSNSPSRGYTKSHKINPCYYATTLAQQTANRRLPKMQRMEVEQPQKENSKEMIEITIKEFMEAAHQYLFGLRLESQPALIAVQARQVR